MTKNVEHHLTEIFKSVADFCDGGCDPEDIKLITESYEKAMKNKEVGEFYGELVESNPFNQLI